MSGDLSFGQIRRLAAVLDVPMSDVTRALAEHGRDGLETLIDHHFEGLAEIEEKRLGDAWAARLGLSADASSHSARRRVYAEGRQSLEDAWLAHCGIEEV